MAQLIQPFNAHEYDPTQNAGSLPIGRHKVVIESSEVKANSKNDGGYLQLDLKIIEGPQAGSSGAHRLNLYHSNQQTVEIANRQLSALCHCINVFMVNDSGQLHNIPFVVEVGPQKNNPQYTEVKKVLDINGDEPGKVIQSQQPDHNQTAVLQGHTNANHPAWGVDNKANTQPQFENAPAWNGQPQQAVQNQPQQPVNSWNSQSAQTHAQQETPIQQNNVAGGVPPWAKK